MPTLTSIKLFQLLHSSLGLSEVPTGTPKPAILSLPDIGQVRIYLWTTTPDNSQSGRPSGEHKSQIILPDTPRGSRQHLVIDNTPTFLMGYSPIYGVFVAWEARCHKDSGYSKNLQVKEDLLREGSYCGWAIDDIRRTANGQEVRVAIHPSHLRRFLRVSILADGLSLEGKARRKFLLAHAPDLGEYDIAARVEAGEDISLPEIERARVAANHSRLERDSRFSRNVLEQYGHQCSLCQIQLNALEGAHIIPVHDPRGTDEIWNGISLCKNHHILFDRRILLIDTETVVRVDDETIEVLRGNDRLGGYEEILGVYRNKPVRILPHFYTRDSKMKRRMQAALNVKFQMSSAS